ncbi:hypothetical protein M9H77_18907 [Catharanthus roseus]|uniref:Uncharacterized protein n=1 Tax=Catharanthus roseus TaxID=4058 RepID=A0ACC0B8T4_CATRO|nr:hypothetical protein M9H77_18907 [Catharanthus roseus]
MDPLWCGGGGGGFRSLEFQGRLYPSVSNDFEGQFFPSAVSQFSHPSFQRQLGYFDRFCYQGIPRSSSYPYQQFQDFEYFVVMDFEATCDKGKIIQPQEIIEFPAVIVNAATGQLEAYFQTYLRPTHNPKLTDFCKDLTGIQQIQVDAGVTLNEALVMFDEWLEKNGIKKTNFAVVTWGDWDCRVMLESECQYKKIRKPSYFNKWINLKVSFREVFGNFRCDLKQGIEIAGLNWLGRPHCGLDDATNTAHLLVRLIQMGFKFSITESLTGESNFIGKEQ